VKVIWSIILLMAVSLAIATVYFFGHALSVHEKVKWLGASGICGLLAVALIFAVVKFDRHTPDATLHL
jgi:uncharacterized membrane protein YadS